MFLSTPSTLFDEFHARSRIVHVTEDCSGATMVATYAFETFIAERHSLNSEQLESEQKLQSQKNFKPTKNNSLKTLKMTWNTVVSKKSRKRSPSPPMKSTSQSASPNRRTISESEDFSLMTSAFPRLPTILKSYSGNVIDIPADIPLRDEPVTSSEQMSTLKDVIQKVDAMKAANEKSRMERINSILDDEINLIQIKDQCRQDFRSGLVNILPPSASPSVTKKSDRLFEILKMRQPGTALSHFSIWQDTLNLLDDQKFADDFEADRANHLFRVRQIPIHLPIERPTISQIISSPKVSPSTLTLAAPIDKSMTQTPKMKKGRGRRVQLGLFR